MPDPEPQHKMCGSLKFKKKKFFTTFKKKKKKDGVIFLQPRA